MDGIACAWKRIDIWFESFAPALANAFFPGATKSEIEEAETALGLQLPPSLKTSYGIHNGASPHVSPIGGNPGLATLSALVDGWKSEQELHTAWAEERAPKCLADEGDQPVQPVWWHRAWLPFTADGAGNLYCFDLAPLPGGHMGQILYWDHEVGPFRVRLPGIEALLETYADQVEAGLHLLSAPLIPLERLTHLKERRAAFLQPSPAKSVLHQAIRKGYEQLSVAADEEHIHEILALYKQVFEMEAATAEDRFFAYYGFLTWHLPWFGYNLALYSLIDTYEAEAHEMATSHWVHEDFTLLMNT